MKTKELKPGWKHKIILAICLLIILFSTDIANWVASDHGYGYTDMDCIRYQISIVIPCVIVSTYSCVKLILLSKK